MLMGGSTHQRLGVLDIVPTQQCNRACQACIESTWSHFFCCDGMHNEALVQCTFDRVNGTVAKDDLQPCVQGRLVVDLDQRMPSGSRKMTLEAC